jgi:segregation and condensation protein B
MDTSLSQILEALIFASPKPLSAEELTAALKGAGESSETDAAQAFATTSEAQVLEALTQLDAALEAGGRSFRLLEQASGWGFVTRPEYAPWVRQLYPEAKPARLSGPALETLAIIAYRQPVTRADIEAVRGVAVDGVMQVLLDRSLVRIAGRADQPGRPLLYSTTDYFLEHFGLKSTGDLPNASELGRIPLPSAPPAEEKPGRRKDRKTGENTGESAPELPFAEVQPAENSAPSPQEPPSTEPVALVEAGAAEPLPPPPASLDGAPGEEEPPPFVSAPELP